jgi:hypothetical protein
MVKKLKKQGQKVTAFSPYLMFKMSVELYFSLLFFNSFIFSPYYFNFIF